MLVPQTYQRLIDVATQVFNEDFSAPLEQIAERAGVTRRTLHRYFASREELLSKCLEEARRVCSQAMADAMDSTSEPRTQLEQMLNAGISCGTKYALFTKLESQHAQPPAAPATNCPTVPAVLTQNSFSTNKMMTLEILQAKEDLRNLVDAYASLGDEKRIAEVMALFTPTAVYQVYMNGILVANTSGTANLEQEFNGHAAAVKTYFTLNGQHTVRVEGDTATGVSFSQIKMLRASEGADILTDCSVRYDDLYVRQGGNWLIKERTGHFIIVEARPLSH